MSIENEYSPAMRSALRQLEKLIAEGVEFPDACWKVCQRTGFMVDELRNVYDRACAERRLGNEHAQP